MTTAIGKVILRVSLEKLSNVIQPYAATDEMLSAISKQAYQMSQTSEMFNIWQQLQAFLEQPFCVLPYPFWLRFFKNPIAAHGDPAKDCISVKICLQPVLQLMVRDSEESQAPVAQLALNIINQSDFAIENTCGFAIYTLARLRCFADYKL